MMEIHITRYKEEDLPEMIAIWNGVVNAGEAFPQEEPLNSDTAKAFFKTQSCSAIARKGETGPIVGLYILHPNNVGRCGHICNASYAVHPDYQGQGIGLQLVRHSLAEAGRLGFRIMQFNAVVRDNIRARMLYENLGFQPLGLIREGFKSKSGQYKDICLYWRKL